LSLECLRRNLATEIAQGKVIVVPAGVWSSDGSFPLRVSSINPAGHSMVKKEVGETTVTVPVYRIDTLVQQLRLSRVDYIKIDIEGAEREALAGATKTLSTYHPTLMIESYQRPDDMVAIPKVVMSSFSGYSLSCGPCQPLYEGSKIIAPHVIYFQ
jgi:FkbM family methyltransferase